MEIFFVLRQDVARIKKKSSESGPRFAGDLEAVRNLCDAYCALAEGKRVEIEEGK